MQLGQPFALEASPLAACYAQAKQAQWELGDVDWGAPHATADAAPAVSRAAADLGAACHRASEACMRAAARLTATVDQADARLLLAVHVQDYARHVEGWRRYLEYAGGGGHAGAGWSALLASRLDAAEAPPLILANLLATLQPLLHAAYVELASGWDCEVGRALCRHLVPDLDRHLRAGRLVWQQCLAGSPLPTGGAALAEAWDGLAPVLGAVVSAAGLSRVRERAAARVAAAPGDA